MVEFRATELRYTRVAMVLHWLIAALILYNLAIGYFMEGLSQPLRGIIILSHISSGITVLALTVIRVLWRLTHNPPAYPPEMKRWEHNVAHIVHFALYAAMVLMPLTGWALISANPPKGSPGAAAAAAAAMSQPLSSAAKQAPAASPPGATHAPAPPRKVSGLKVWGIIPLPMIAPVAKLGATPGGVEPQKELHDTFVYWHAIGSYLLIVLLILHIAGALKHQILDSQPELARMGVGRSGRARYS